MRLVEVLAVVQPSLFQTKSCYEILMLFITHTDGEIVERALRILQNVMSDIETVDKQMSGSFQPVLMKLITQVSEGVIHLKLQNAVLCFLLSSCLF